MNDEALLRQYEPVACYTEGELFFPIPVDEYIRRCSLWLRDDDGRERQLVTKGLLTPKMLGSYREVPPDHTLYLRFVDEPLQAIEYQRWLRRPDRPSFRAPARLSRVGLLPRMLSSVFDASLIVRGTVPGGTTAAAERKFRDMRKADGRFAYYGRVMREGGYTILHYLFFYAMNDWRSSFFGVNDHEADWEQMFVYLSEDQAGNLKPRWVALSAHDLSGSDLRRRWDDPELQKYDQTHPIIYVGAGSHASYFQPGDYLLRIEPEFLVPLKNGLVLLRKFWIETLRQGRATEVDEEVGAFLSIPFVEYARGDGTRIGPGQEESWRPIILSPEMEWVDNYRGLWGLDTKDPLGTERAPAGPKFNRDGSVRRSWYAPLGWAGLDTVTPQLMTAAELKSLTAELIEEQKRIGQEIDACRSTLRRLALETESLRQTDYLNHLFLIKQKALSDAELELHELQTRLTRANETEQACRSYLSKLEQGDWGDPQAHLRHKNLPEPPLNRQNRLVEIWAALSGGLLLLVMVVLFILFPGQLLILVALAAFAFATIEATVRGRLSNLLLNVVIFFAIVTSVVLIWEFWRILLLFGFVLLTLLLMRENLREIWGR